MGKEKVVTINITQFGRSKRWECVVVDELSRAWHVGRFATIPDALHQAMRIFSAGEAYQEHRDKLTGPDRGASGGGRA